ncbi:hypothetical protein CSUB01_03265 [Colletotrichum sublineola]|uniref:Uncharacterized protein n=1 Tax=Colletotrichum sublineola TaxID=1173701 RepID=A0A066XAY5_COLSU|nr:hypothetical protein CSUB01_03265 [Colletotrichum sublineola]
MPGLFAKRKVDCQSCEARVKSLARPSKILDLDCAQKDAAQKDAALPPSVEIGQGHDARTISLGQKLWRGGSQPRAHALPYTYLPVDRTSLDWLYPGPQREAEMSNGLVIGLLLRWIPPTTCRNAPLPPHSPAVSASISSSPYLSGGIGGLTTSSSTPRGSWPQKTGPKGSTMEPVQWKGTPVQEWWSIRRHYHLEFD